MKTKSQKILSVFMSMLIVFMYMTSASVQAVSQKMIFNFNKIEVSAGQDIQFDIVTLNPIAIKELNQAIINIPDGFTVTGMSETSPAFNGTVTYSVSGNYLNFSIASNGTLGNSDVIASIYMHVDENCTAKNYMFQWSTNAVSCILATGNSYTPQFNFGIITVGEGGNVQTTTTTTPAPTTTTTTTETTTTTTTTTTTAKKYTYNVRFVDEETNQNVSGVKYNIRSYYTYDPVQVVQTSGDTPKSYEFISDTAYVSLTTVETPIPDGYYIPDGATRWELSANNPDLTVYLRKSETTTTTESTTTTTTTTETTTTTTTAVTSGMCGDDVSWKYENGTLLISGTGEMNDYEYKNETYAPWHDLNENIENIIIENGVTNIGKQAFYECTSVKSVIIPDSIESIDSRAFYGCTSLTSVNIPDSVTYLSTYVFENCTSLETITIPEKLTDISYKAFNNTIWLENRQKENPFVIVNGVLIDGTTCSGDIAIPDNVKIIGKGAFMECSSIKSVTIPENVTAIKLFAFMNCNSLEKVTILNPYCEINSSFLTISNNYDGNSVYFNGTIYGYENSTAYEYAVNSNYNFSSLGQAPAINQSGICGDNLTWKLENNTLTISGMGNMYDYEDYPEWYYYRNDIKNIIIENGVTSIGRIAFSYCDSFTSVTIPESVSIINQYAFSECNSIKAITIPENVTVIDDYAFLECESLESITILNPDCKINGGNGTISNPPAGLSHLIEFRGTIYGYENSTAQEYAENCNYKFSAIVQETDVNYGDVNNDGFIDSVDASLVLSEYALLSTENGIGEFTPEQNTIADLNKDGEVNASDATLILMYYSYLSTDNQNNKDSVDIWLSYTLD
ncbi:MAG: leucine-rich repeat protein [Ruminococcus sp.]|nr:leucine-rich repeat protein [Ruminococcus sp.]